MGQALLPPLPKHGPRGFMLASNGRKTLLDKTMMGPVSPTLPKARIIATTLFVCTSDTSANQDTTSSRTAEI